jgi:hypothetical protein
MIFYAGCCRIADYHTVWQRFDEHCINNSPYYIEHEVYNTAPPGQTAIRFRTELVQDSICLQCPPGQRPQLPPGLHGAEYIPGMIDITKPYRITAYGDGCKGEPDTIEISYAPGGIDMCRWRSNPTFFQRHSALACNCDERLISQARALLRNAYSAIPCIAPKMSDNCPDCNPVPCRDCGDP